MAVYDDFGPGWTPPAMAAGNVTVVFDTISVRPYKNPADIFQTSDGKFGNVEWIDQSVLR
jgi:hypothetical protein